jgi:leucyl-tRNA synthetase
MSKSKGNVLSPDNLIDRYGADALRLYILFIGPADQDIEWNDAGVEGTYRFLTRLWRVVGEQAGKPIGAEAPDTPLARAAHRAIEKVTDDIERRFVFNTPIAAVMELVNEVVQAPDDPAARFAAETAVSLIQPYAPHIAEELWQRFGYERLWDHAWPQADPALLGRAMVEIVVQVNGKVRDRLHLPPDTPDQELVAAALASERVQAHLEGGEPRRTVVVPGKLVSLVA